MPAPTKTFIAHRARVAYSRCCSKPAIVQVLRDESKARVEANLFDGGTISPDESRQMGKRKRGKKMGEQYICTQCHQPCTIYTELQKVPIEAPLFGQEKLKDGVGFGKGLDKGDDR